MSEIIRSRRRILEVGRRVLLRLEQKGWNQARLARECGRTPQWVAEVLRRRYLAAPAIQLLARVLDVTPGYLMPDPQLDGE